MMDEDIKAAFGVVNAKAGRNRRGYRGRCAIDRDLLQKPVAMFLHNMGVPANPAPPMKPV